MNSTRDCCGLPLMPCRVILRGIDVLFPYVELNAFPLIDLVGKVLKNLMIEQINELQRATWPHILRGRNCFIVGGKSARQGKTLSYLVPVVAKALKDVDIIRRGSEHGQLGIILCSCKASGDKIEKHLADFLGRDMTIYHGTRSDPKLKYNMKQNPEFLICRPDFLLFLHQKYPNLLGFERLRYMIIDDCHIMQREFEDSVKNVLQVLSHAVQKIKRKWPIQFIFCGEEWNDMMREACREDSPFNDPVLIISSLTQTLVYGNVKLFLLKADENEKFSRTAEIIKSGISKPDHFVIVCQEREMADKIGTYLFRREGIFCTYFEDDNQYTTRENFAQMRRDWKSQSESHPIVLITTDEDLPELDLNFVANIIHFELPKGKQDYFGMRHFCMWSLFPQTLAEKNSHGELRSYVLLSPNDPELAHLVSFFDTFKAFVEPELQQLAATKTLASADMELCEGIRYLGKCTSKDKQKCQRTLRHFLTGEDLKLASTIPKFKDGRVEVKILNAYKPNIYGGRVLNFYQFKNGLKTNNISYEDIVEKRNFELTKFYEEEANRRQFLQDGNVQGGSLCGFKWVTETEEFYTRGRPVQVIPGHRPRIRVFGVDIGEHRIVPSDQLYILPDGFEYMPPVCVTIIIADLKPLGDEDEYDHNWAGFGHKKFNVEGKTLIGAVLLSIDDTIWVHTLCECEKIAGGGWAKKLDLRTELVRQRNVAENNPGHLQTLYKLCQDVGFSCSMYEATETIGREFQRIEDEYDWAFLKTSTTAKPVEISAWCTFTVNPDKIYLVQYEFHHQLDTLEEELHEEIVSLIKGQHSDYEKKFVTHYEVGLCVAAKDVESYWARAIITNMVSDPTDGLLLRVFFVDTGDMSALLTSKKLFPLPKKFVYRLPFQAVAVRFDHIQPKATNVDADDNHENVSVSKYSRQWENEAIDLLLDNLIPANGEAPVVQVVALSKITEKATDDPMCNYYNAFIMPPTNCTTGQEAEVGEILISKQLAEIRFGAWEKWETTKASLLRKLNEKLEIDHLEPCDDEGSDNEIELDSGDEDYGQGSDCPAPAGEMSVPVGEYEQLLEALGPIGITNEPDHTVAPKIERFSEKFNSEIAGQSTGQQSPHSNGKGLRPCPIVSAEAPAIGTGVKVPSVQWSQTKTQLTLKICLPDIHKYKFSIDENGRTIVFESMDPTDYKFSLKLFAKVHPPAQESLYGQYLLIRLEKLSRGKWDKISATKSPHWLRPDLNEMCDSDSSDDVELEDMKQVLETTQGERKQEQDDEITKLDLLDMRATMYSDDSDSVASDNEILMD